MSRDWESVFTTWSHGPGRPEQEKAVNVERQIRQAISENRKLDQRNIRVFTQGSYRNRVNVRKIVMLSSLLFALISTFLITLTIM